MCGWMGFVFFVLCGILECVVSVRLGDLGWLYYGDFLYIFIILGWEYNDDTDIIKTTDLYLSARPQEYNVPNTRLCHSTLAVYIIYLQYYPSPEK